MSAEHDPGNIHTILYASDDETRVREYLLRNAHDSLVTYLHSLNAQDCIAAVLDAMAECALRIWPRWYDSELFVDSPSSSLDDRLHSFLAIIELCRRNRNIEPAWLKKAVHLASMTKKPLTAGLAGEIQIRQLVLALTNRIAAITLMIPDALPGTPACEGFPRAVEWLARESGLDVTVVVPRELAAGEDFASLLYNAENFDTPAAHSHRLRENPPAAASRPDAAPIPPISRIPDERAPEAERIIGSPHPKSKGEQLLAERLSRDAQLSGMFGHNQPVTTGCGRTFIVDLLWPGGGVVVEIDGYYYHSNSVAFSNDRDRDYRLLISGYRVLRLPHDEVVRDVELAMEKIRDVVNFIQKSESETNNVR